MDVKIVNPIDDLLWDQNLPSHKDLSVFHTRAWAITLASSYGYKPLYFTLANGSGVKGFIPVMEVSSLFTGKRGVALPFTDICHPIVSSREDFNRLLKAILEYGKKSNWKYFELRGGQDYLINEVISETYIEHTIDLSRGFKEIEAGIRKSFRRNMQKSIRNNVEIEITRSKRAYEDFMKLHFMTRKRHGLPPQPKSFFDNLYNYCLNDNGCVLLAHYEKQVIAGAVFLTCQKHAICKYCASDMTFQHLRPNNFLFYEAVRYLNEKGFDVLTLGRSDPKNTGLLNFKNGLSKKSEIIHYNRYNFTRKKFISVEHNYDLANKLFNRMPVSVLNFTGRLLYRHLG